MQKEITEWFKNLQSDICKNLESLEKDVLFQRDEWKRPGGGGGLTCVLENGNIIEKGGVNFSSVYGDIPEFLFRQFPEAKADAEKFYATGVSIVMHPVNPFVPIIHMNVRYFEMGKMAWFGGGIDLTPHYVDKSDAAFFHSGLKTMCEKHNENYYNNFKKEADDYFFIPHRNETRGIGGIFFDRLGKTNTISIEARAEFVKSTGKLFFPVYSELIRKNNDKPFGQNEIDWQHLRRGRYVEFNLIYDKGTKFGLETAGRTESILMSLPPMAKWKYDFKPLPGSMEEETLSLLKKDIDWTRR